MSLRRHGHEICGLAPAVTGLEVATAIDPGTAVFVTLRLRSISGPD
jgi:hypothetical protein